MAYEPPPSGQTVVGVDVSTTVKQGILSEGSVRNHPKALLVDRYGALANRLYELDDRERAGGDDARQLLVDILEELVRRARTQCKKLAHLSNELQVDASFDTMRVHINFAVPRGLLWDQHLSLLSVAQELGHGLSLHWESDAAAEAFIQSKNNGRTTFSSLLRNGASDGTIMLMLDQGGLTADLSIFRVHDDFRRGLDYVAIGAPEGVTAGMHEINIRCLETVMGHTMRYLQVKGANVKDYAHLMVALNLSTAADEAWFRATFLNKFEDNKIHPDNAPSMRSASLDSDSATEIRFSLFGRRDPQHKHGREYVDVTIPLSDLKAWYDEILEQVLGMLRNRLQALRHEGELGRGRPVILMLVSPSGCNQYVQQFYEESLREYNVKVEADPQASNLKDASPVARGLDILASKNAQPISFPLSHMAIGVEGEEEYDAKLHPEAVVPKKPHKGKSLDAPLRETWISQADGRLNISHIFQAIKPGETIVLLHGVTRAQEDIRIRVICRKGDGVQDIYQPHQYMMGFQDGKDVFKEDFCAVKYLYCRIPRAGLSGYAPSEPMKATAIRVVGEGQDAQIGAKVVSKAQSRYPDRIRFAKHEMERLFCDDSHIPGLHTSSPAANNRSPVSTRVEHPYSTRSQGQTSDGLHLGHAAQSRKRIAPGHEARQNAQAPPPKRRATHAITSSAALTGTGPAITRAPDNPMQEHNPNQSTAMKTERPTESRVTTTVRRDSADRRSTQSDTVPPGALVRSSHGARSESEATPTQWYYGVNPSPLRSVEPDGQRSGLVQRTARRGRGGILSNITTARRLSDGNARQSSESPISSSSSESSNASLYCA
ncbi:hypothetical protein MBLNU457_g2869t1 [Dothideomycetes sp. NU457]